MVVDDKSAAHQNGGVLYSAADILLLIISENEVGFTQNRRVSVCKALNLIRYRPKRFCSDFDNFTSLSDWI